MSGIPLSAPRVMRARWYLQVKKYNKTVSAVCNIFGISRKTYYKWYNLNHNLALRTLVRRKPHPQTKLTPRIKVLVYDQKIKYNYGPKKGDQRAKRVPPFGSQKAEKFCDSAGERSRTSTPFREHASKACAYANSATPANIFLLPNISSPKRYHYFLYKSSLKKSRLNIRIFILNYFLRPFAIQPGLRIYQNLFAFFNKYWRLNS